MYISRILEGKQSSPQGRLGLVSFSARDAFGVSAGAESRNMAVAAPGGYCYRPREGQETVVLSTEDGAVCAGVIADPAGLAPGEIKITGPNGGCIFFAADGTITVNGQVFPPAKT